MRNARHLKYLASCYRSFFTESEVAEEARIVFGYGFHDSWDMARAAADLANGETR